MQRMRIRYLILAALLLFGAVLALPADSSLAGLWQGQVENPPLEFTLLFKESGGHLEAMLNMPSNGIEDLGLEDIEFDGSKLTFVVPNPDRPIRCQAARNEDGSFSGTYSLGDQTGNFTMKRAD